MDQIRPPLLLGALDSVVERRVVKRHPPPPKCHVSRWLNLRSFEKGENRDGRQLLVNPNTIPLTSALIAPRKFGALGVTTPKSLHLALYPAQPRHHRLGQSRPTYEHHGQGVGWRAGDAPAVTVAMADGRAEEAASTAPAWPVAAASAASAAWRAASPLATPQ